uniref:DUF4220 domain-containing protein n=1 Tax=Leersia perrieri TaxID=77586 RepID=A0A0D9XU96_9ORYZ
MEKGTHMASVELWVLMTTLMLVVRFLLDLFGPWHADRSMVATIQVIEVLNYSMVQYTMGLMQLSAAKVNDYFQVWAVLLVTLQFSVKIGRPYSFYKQMPLLDLMSSFWAANIIRLQTFYLHKIPLWIIWSMNAVRIISYFFSTDKAAEFNQENTRLVSDYMRYEHTLEDDKDVAVAVEPVDRSGVGDKERKITQQCRYLVLGEDKELEQAQENSTQADKIRMDIRHHKVVTVNKVWRVARRNPNGLLGRWTSSRDLCLAFALYKLMRRRFYHLPLHEVRQEKTAKLVFDGIMKEKDDATNYERPFRIAALELSFLQDLFYSKHAAMFAGGFPAMSMLLSALLIAATGYIAYPVHYIPRRMDQADRNTITHGVFITRLMVALIVGKELLEIYLYVFSQWTKVLVLCNNVKHSGMRHPKVETATRALCWFITRGKWNQMIRQHNLFISPKWLKVRFLCFKFNRRMGTKSPEKIKLEPEVKRAILDSFKSLQNSPERLESYLGNAFGSNEERMNQLKWAVDDLEADTHRILVWHIATCLCEINLSDEATALKVRLLRPKPFVNRSRTPEDVWEHYYMAATLSNYCVYLLTMSLVPDNGLTVNMIFKEVRRETFYATYTKTNLSLQDMYDRLKEKFEPQESQREKEVPKSTNDTSRTNKQVPEGINTSRTNEQVPEGVDATGRTNEQVPEGTDATSTTNEEVPEGRDAAIMVELPPEEDIIEEEEEEPRAQDHNDELALEEGVDQTTKEKSVLHNEDVFDNSIIWMGTKLAKQLIDSYGIDRAGLWRDLAEFWAGFLLNLAASTRAAKHKTNLVRRGELITMLWALLSHAGFLGKTRHGHTLLDPDDLDDADPLR